jgi:transcriptional regulator with XRE-family HTH domain
VRELIMAKFGERLKELRKEAGLQQADIQIITGARSQQTVSSWENGVVPKLSKLVILAKHFNVTVDYLVGSSDVRDSIDSKKPAIDHLIEQRQNAGFDLSLLQLENENISKMATKSFDPTTMTRLVPLLSQVMLCCDIAIREACNQIKLTNEFELNAILDFIQKGTTPFISETLNSIIDLQEKHMKGVISDPVLFYTEGPDGVLNGDGTIVID